MSAARRNVGFESGSRWEYGLNDLEFYFVVSFYIYSRFIAGYLYCIMIVWTCI